MAELTDATVLLTGATSGIGRATARLITPRAGALLVHGPEPSEAVTQLVGELMTLLRPGARVAYLQADYAHLADVVRLADDVVGAADHVDVIIHNAALPGPPTRTVTADGNEVTLQVNFLAPAALTRLLAGRLEPTEPLRVVNVASATHLSATLDLDDLDLRRGYTAVAAYARAKLALVADTCWLADHPPRLGVEVVSMHPGVIATGLLHAMFTIGGDPPEKAARAIVGVAEGTHDSGTYYDLTSPADPNPLARDPGFQRRLHELTLERLARAGIAAPNQRTGQ